MLQSGASFCRFLSVALDAPVRGTGFTPGRSSPGASALVHSAPVAPIRGVFFTYSLRCLGCSIPWHRVHPQTIQSGGLGRAPLRPGCSNPGRLFVVFSPLPRMLQSVAPGSPPDDPVRGLVPCFIPPRLLQSGASLFHILSVASDAPVHGTGFNPGQPVWGLVLCFIPPRLLHSGASFYRILPVASDAPVRGTWFISGRSSPRASAVLHSAPVAPFRGVFLMYSLRCLGYSCPLRRVLPWTIQSGGLGCAPLCPGCSNLGRLYVVFSSLPRTLQSEAPGSHPDDPVRGLVPCFIPPWLLQSGVFFFTYSVRCLGCSIPWHRVHPPTIPSGGLGRAPLPPWMLQSGASLCRILSVALDAPVRGT